MTDGVFTLNELQTTVPDRISTGLRRLDKALGRGFVRRSLTLFAGHAGAGKSSLLTLVSGRVAASGRTVLYVSSEEDLSQFSLRARRLRIPTDGKFYITDDASLDSLRRKALALQPDLLIVDSIQSIRHSDQGGLCLENMRSARHLLAELLELKKELDTAIILVGHETKSHEISGSAQLQHMVDLILKLDTDEVTGDRVLTVQKNRFAPISSAYRFMMGRRGEIKDAPPAPVVNYRTPMVLG
jgi:DNA repair protein RadA/Sms